MKLSDLSDAITYGHTASAQSQDIGPQFLRITDIQDEDVSWDSVPFCKCTEREEEALKLREGDLLFARTGATTGKSFLIRECPKRAVFASYLIRVRLSRLVDPVFLSHFFRSEGYWNQVNQNARGAAQPGINATILGTLRIPLPPINEQRRIAAILDQAEALRAKRRQALAKLDTLTQSLFLEMFGDPAWNPHKWPMLRLGKLAVRFSDGPFGSNLKSEHYEAEGMRVVRLQNIGVNEFIDRDRAYISQVHATDLKKHLCQPGDVLVGTLGEPNLRACIQPDWLKQVINKADCVQIRVDREVATPEFVSSLLNVPSLEQMASGLILGQTRSRIAMGRLRELPVPVPPVNLQRKFSVVHTRIASFASAYKSSKKKDDALFTSLQHKAFRGEL